MRTKKLNADVQDAAEKAFYWKEALREYKEINGMTYRGIAKAMKKTRQLITGGYNPAMAYRRESYSRSTRSENNEDDCGTDTGRLYAPRS